MSTFSAPTSATSGLQSYSGWGTRRRQKRKKLRAADSGSTDSAAEKSPIGELAMDRLNVFVPITKVDAVKGIVYGVLAAEEPDRAEEIFDYAGSKPYFEKWSGDISKATNG